jgi:hypothetical protein
MKRLAAVFKSDFCVKPTKQQVVRLGQRVKAVQNDEEKQSSMLGGNLQG